MIRLMGKRGTKFLKAIEKAESPQSLDTRVSPNA